MTKQKKVFQKIAKVFLLSMLIGSFTIVTSCKDDDFEVKTETKTYKWYYKVEASPDAVISNIIYSIPTIKKLNGIDEVSINSGINSTTWTSPTFEVITESVSGQNGTVHNAKIKAKATSISDSAVLKVQIYVNGVLKKEVKDIGQFLTSEANYNIQ